MCKSRTHETKYFADDDRDNYLVSIHYHLMRAWKNKKNMYYVF